MANGINFYLRFIVTELVPIHFHAKAITLTISGGILAAFIGPETGNKTINLFPKHQYLGVYLMTGVLNFINVVCILCIQFTKTKEIKTDILEINDENKMKRLPTGTSSLSELNSTLPLVDEEIGSQNKKKDEVVETIDTFENKNIFVLWYSLLCNVDFLIPMFLSALAWTIMSLPMSLVRTTMADLGYTSIQSLRVMEFHFVGMFGTGLITGTLIQKYGYYIICIVGFIICCISVLLNLLVKYNITNNNTNDKNGTFFLWLFGMLLIGVGWNFSFTGATVWITKLYNLPKKDVSDTKQEAEIITLDIVDEEHKQSISVKDTVQYTKNQVQSTNDFFMFFLSGIWTFSASYIYKTSGGDLIGWKTINYTVIGLLILNLIIIIGYYFSHIWKKQK